MASADRLIDVFNEAKARPIQAERDRYLAAACADAPELKEQVLSLLEAHDRAAGFMQEPVLLTASTGVSEKPGDRIGRYKLLEKIGEGGCGVVYMAEQESPVRRRVALKVIKAGMDTDSVIARFEAERQALAMMEHPSIARVYDAGATEAGRPFFVMELVRGVRITEYCQENKLGIEARLRLFLEVCHAVQHAHQKGIIHRDIKPSNILVTVNDGVAVPKVIDFGIAKATGERLTEKTCFTRFHSFLGTPAYTSPEQAEMSSMDVDTRSDIYSLGVLLYEMLTGWTPFDSEELLLSGLDEMRRTIREKEPVRPSTRLTQEIAEARRSGAIPEAGRIADLLSRHGCIPAIRGDLDWIVMKCLEKDRSRRYESVNGIAADIRRHLNGEPITARPPSTWYVLGKLARRNRGAWLASTLVLAALLMTLLVLAVSNARIRQERNQKAEALKERGTALEAARQSAHQAREQLFTSLQSQAQARRTSRQKGQRIESLKALTEAALIRPESALRDSAIASMAIPDLQLGEVWHPLEKRPIGYDANYEHYSLARSDGAIGMHSIPANKEIWRTKANAGRPLDHPGGRFTVSPKGEWAAGIERNGRLVIVGDGGKVALKQTLANCVALAFSPNGTRLAVGRMTEIVCFDLQRGEEIWRSDLPATPYSIAFHNDNRTLAVSYDLFAEVTVLDLEDAAYAVRLPLGETRRTVAAWHPERRLLAIGGGDPRIHIWDVTKQIKLAILAGHAQEVTSLSFHPEGELLISCSWDSVLRVWHPVPARLLMRLPFTGRAGFSADGHSAGVVSRSDGQRQLLRVVPSQEYHTFVNNFEEGKVVFYEGAITSDGNLLAVACSDGVRLWDIQKGCEAGRLALGPTHSVAFRGNGHELVTCGPVEGVRRWQVRSRGETGERQIEELGETVLGFRPTRMAGNGGEQGVAVVGEEAGRWAMLDLERESVREKGMPHPAAGFVDLSPNGERLATSGWHSDSVKIWERQTGKLIKEWRVGTTSRAFFTPDGGELIVARSESFAFFDLESFELKRRMPREIGLYAGYIAFNPDGSLMALELAPGKIHLLETGTGRNVAILEDPYGDVSSWMGFSPDGTQLMVVASYASAIHRWDLRAIRARLRSMSLDWDWPEFPSAE